MAGLQDCPSPDPLRTGWAEARPPGETLPPPNLPRRGRGRDRSRFELRLFLAQRASAMVLAPLVLLHLGIILYAVRGGLTAAEILGRTKGSLLWAAVYGLFVLATAVHGSIGLRAILREWLGRPRVADAAAVLFAGMALILGFRAVTVLT